MFLIKRGLWCLAALCIALSLAVYNGYSLGAAALFLLSPFAFFLPKIRVMPQDKALGLVFSVYFLLWILFVYLDGGHYRELDRPSRFLLVVPVLVLLLRTQGVKRLLWFGAVAGSYGAFGVAMYERFILGEDRAGWGENPIMFGNISLMLGLLSAVGALYFYSKQQFVLVFLALVGCMSGIMGSFLSGSRGGWAAVPLILLFLVWQSRNLLGKRAIIGICITALLSASVVLNTPKLGVLQRIDQAVYDIQGYFNGNVNTSIGSRFQMWEANLHLFASSPLFGVGEYHGLTLKKQLADDGLISQEAAQFSHAHNEYIDALGLRGIVGFLALMAVYLVPLHLFLAKMHEYRDTWNVKAYAMAGAVVPMSYMGFALTQSMFSHNIGVMMYVFPIVFFWAATRWAEKEAKGEI